MYHLKSSRSAAVEVWHIERGKCWSKLSTTSFFFFFAYYVGPIQNNNTAIKINENIQKTIVLHIKYSKELYAVCRLYVCRKKGKSNSG